jgi:putative hydrolase of the HAD superfamily
MLPDRRAVLFDLDDTLYPASRFVASGFGAVADYLARVYNLDRSAVHQTLMAAPVSARGRELQCCVSRFGLPAALVPELVEIIRNHEPSLMLPRMSSGVLTLLRRNWKLAVVTNGPPQIQARKIAALGLAPLVDLVIYANEHGSGAGKPDREPFLEALRRLNVSPAHAVFVGDDDYCDVFGAARVGMRTILAAAWNLRPTGRPVRADAVVVRLRDVPGIADYLLDSRWRRRHVA